MATSGRSLPPFLRDAIVAAVVAVVLLAPILLSIGPEFLRYPGYLLYFGLMVIYIVLGGETENALGPSIVEIGLYVVLLALIVAMIARFVRTRADTSGLATWEFPVAALLAVVGTALVLVGAGSLVDLLAVPPLQMAASLLLGLLSIGGGLALAKRAQ